MSLFNEIEISVSGPIAETFGVVQTVEPDSLGARIGLLPGDHLLRVNGEPVQDVIDVQYYAAEETVSLAIRRDEEVMQIEARRSYGEPFGVTFEHPTFDTDIRRCNNLCEFCFVLQMAPRFRRTLYIKDDDYRYSFLFGHYVTLTNLDDHDWWRIETMGLSPLYVSVHVTDLEMRREFLRNPSAPDILPQLRRLAAADIEIHTQLVIVPEFNDGAWLSASVEALAEMWPAVRSISVVPVGLTTHHKYKMRPHTSAEAQATLAYVEGLQPEFIDRFGVRFVYPTDEWYLVSQRTVPPLDHYDDQALQENGLGMVRAFLDEWLTLQTEIKSWYADHDRPTFTFSRLTLVTATLFADTLRETLTEWQQMVDVEIDLEVVVNKRLGETITVAGLLMAADVIDHLEGVDLGEVVILPRVMFDHPLTITLDDQDRQAVADRLGRPIALADSMGDVWDVLIGQSETLIWPRPAENGAAETHGLD